MDDNEGGDDDDDDGEEKAVGLIGNINNDGDDNGVIEGGRLEWDTSLLGVDSHRSASVQ
jgi:hypothetical protein